MSISSAKQKRSLVVGRLAAVVASVFALVGCDVIADMVRVPIVDVGAVFTLADATWFEEEETLFIFYRVSAREGLQEASVVELAYRTDNIDQPFVQLQSLVPVHPHAPVVCNLGEGYCGSFSIHVPDIPRDVQLRLRYHRNGDLALDADLNFHVVATGDAHTNRSAIVYGVFNEENTHVQWRLRHLFPEIRNELASELGLRRTFQIENSVYGGLNDRDFFLENPYGYGALGDCPTSFDSHPHDVITASGRARFDLDEYEVESYTSPIVCADATVFDALGEFETNALAQKNPEVRPAFPALQTPIREATQVKFMLQVCNDPTSFEHQEMQRQRLSLVPGDRICIDDWETPDFSQRLATRISATVDDKRQLGNDMVLTIAVNRPNDTDIAIAIERMLALVVGPEIDQSSPRVVGAYVFDSAPYAIRSAAVSRVTLWCPSAFGGPDLDQANASAEQPCALQATTVIPINAQLTLAQLPILPTEAQFEEFIDDYGVAQTGRVESMSIKAPIRTPTSDNVPIEDFGLATFFNEEAITPEPDDAFSYCPQSDIGNVFFRVPGFEGIFPLSVLGEVHLEAGLPRYELGLFWQFPYFLELDYLATLAAAAELPEEIPFVAAFGLTSPAEAALGTRQWSQDEFDISEALTQCDRFCDHPVFSSATVYNVEISFHEFASRCYRPQFPVVGDDGFPPDP